ncbi:hypothetical protein AVEN_263327-1 [Araneus ventricosus]|uniref:Uncharacterized protein n=1 Tax=Araneus ventricosus TaxID=182803 RepID=A0A4Y2UI65_ARAVE|nr:hypothetical protein AVEN_256743-1 [Araneus ventricosus]GBO11316.1 hypothetical protein AVEN_263327-1 [Araneus ventricosus]
MLGHPLCTNLAITKLFLDYMMHSSFAYRQFNSNFTFGDLTIVLHELIHSRNRGTVGVTTCACQERGKSKSSRVPPHNAYTRNMVHRSRHCFPYTCS